MLFFQENMTIQRRAKAGAFSLLPFYSFLASHIRIVSLTFGRILVDAGLERCANANKEQSYQKYCNTLTWLE
jgi:hypothetical protein